MIRIKRLTQFTLFCLLSASANMVAAFDYLQVLPSHTPVPADNPMSAQKIALGKRLFFEPLLLGTNRQLSCNQCHNLKQGGDDNRALSIGQKGKYTLRSAPSLWNIGFQTVLYWDGRSISLEAQTLDHLRDPIISAWPNIGALVEKLAELPEYQTAFSEVFPKDKALFYGISGINIARAISSFERTLIANESPFDHYISGNDAAISASAKRGIQAFNDVGCLSCHFGTNFAGPAPGPALKMGDGFYELFPNNLGSHYETQYRLAADMGRFAYTGDPDERYMWRVPPLRNIALTAPYFHNGSVETIEEAIRVMADTQLGKQLSEQTVNDIADFLYSLSGKLPLKHSTHEH
jgi:cytochrome c peroxidase